MVVRCTRITRRSLFKKILFVIALITIYVYYKLLHLPSFYNEFLKYEQAPLSKEERRLEEKIRDYESKIIPNLGNYGEPAYLQGKEKELGEQALKKVALNTVLSDRTPLNRILKDPRNKK